MRVRHDPPSAPIPLVLDSPHSGESIRTTSITLPPRAVVRQAEDTHVARLWSRATARRRDAARGAVPARVHRREPQPRRHRSRAARRRVARADRAVAQDRAGHRPRVAARARRRAACMRASLRAAEIARAHRALLAAVSRGARRRARRAPSRRSAPSGTSTAIRCRRSATRSPDDPGRERADFVLGDRDGTTCEPRVHASSSRDTVRGARLLAWRSTIRTRASSWCASTADPRSAGTACRSRSSARCTWTRRRSSRTPAMRASKRDLRELARALAGFVRADSAASRPRALVWPLDQSRDALLTSPTRRRRCDEPGRARPRITSIPGGHHEV